MPTISTTISQIWNGFSVSYGPKVAIRQHRQYHQRNQHKLHDRGHVALANACRERVQRILEVQEDRDRAAERDRDGEFADHDIGADAEQK